LVLAWRGLICASEHTGLRSARHTAKRRFAGYARVEMPRVMGWWELTWWSRDGRFFHRTT